MAKKVKEVISYFEKLYANKAIYLWGANSEIITKELCDRLFKSYGSSSYNKTYYNNKLKEGKGRIGADCSGSMYPMSGFDTTAQGYYNKCITKGSISYIPLHTACLVFKGISVSSINHIGFYLGNGYVIEMKSSKSNCVKDKLKQKGWKWYGIPDWIDYSLEDTLKTETYNNKEYVIGRVSGCTQLNVRREPKVEAGNIIDILNVNDELPIIKEVNGWYNIITKNNIIGYVSDKYITILQKER